MKAYFLSFFAAGALFGQLSFTSAPDGGSVSVMGGTHWIFAEPAITGAPFSAERVTENALTLADGTRITGPQNRETIYRDSMGRRRLERSITNKTPGPGEFLMIEVRDPVAGKYYLIDDWNKVVHRMALEARPVEIPTAEGEKIRKQWSAEKLGAQTIEGVEAQGSRSTHTIPAGDLGNDRTMTITSEAWRSPELREVLLQKSFDPRYGELTSRLTNLSRSEPDAALFEPPSAYKMVDEKDGFTIVLKK
jgi:hypothetical protein